MQTNNTKHLISIVTVVKNGEHTLEKCIQSVLSQSYKNVEYILINGNSTDKTNQIIEKYKHKINIILKEDDKGIWDAMNKGIMLSNGDIIGFLNSDDYYYNDALETVNNYFSNHNIDFLFGSVEKYKIMHGYTPWKIHWSFGFYTSHSVGFFIKTSQHKKVGLYDINYMSADLDFFYKMINNFKLKGLSTKKKEILGKFRRGGFSSKINYIDHLIELNKIRLNNSQNMLFVYFIFLIKILKKPIKFIMAFFNKFH